VTEVRRGNLQPAPAISLHSATTPGNHGPVGQRTSSTSSMRTALLTSFWHDYVPICSLPDENAKASIDGMKEARFNKSRVCVLPKRWRRAQILPFPIPRRREGRAVHLLTRFNPAYFNCWSSA